MNKANLLLPLLSATLFLASCSRPPQPVVTPPAPKTGVSAEQHACVARCKAGRTQCLRQSKKIYNQCSINAQRTARLEYDAYVFAQMKAKKKEKVQRTQQSFLDLSECQQHPSCKSNYNQCHTRCDL